MTRSWERGNCVRADELLALHPELCEHPEAAVDLIYEELCLRRQYGQEVARAEVLRRFPQWQAQLEILLDCHAILEMEAAPAYPGVGESIGDFRLLAKLGQGGYGSVFLASQTSLADRPVVLKLTPLLGHEHLSLARLQHTHIMPLFSVLEDTERNLRALCMPYFGGATLAALLAGVAAQPLSRRTGQDLLAALDEAQAATGVDLPSRDPARKFLAQASYVQAICWIGACLADALKYAHERGLAHLDVKPSNVLLTADAQPMLLDFHLAHTVIKPDGPRPKWIGGTPLYMSPEQQVALAQLREQRPISVVVDGRSDLYSLGLVLYEALGGSVPENPTSPVDWPRLNECNLQVGAGLADILAKCLAPDPRHRYTDAGALATDLWRHLNDLPLRHVSNRSLAERWRKWRRRRPHALSLLAMVGIVLLVALASGGIVLTYLRHQIDQAARAKDEAKGQMQAGQYDEAVHRLERALSQVENLPGTNALAQELDGQLRRARRAQAARELHRLADRFRLLYGADFLSPAVITQIEDSCNYLWAKRDLIMDRLAPESEKAFNHRSQTAVVEKGAVFEPHNIPGTDPTANAEAELRVGADLLDLAILSTNLRIRNGAGNGSNEARWDALKMLEEAGEICGRSAVLCYERQRHAEALGLTDIARAAERQRLELPPHTAWEHYALGRALLEDQKLEEAAAMLHRAVELEPNGLWPKYYQGICAYRLGRYEDAVLAFTACAALAPRVAGYFYNRALAYQDWGRSNPLLKDRLDRALRDYDTALEIDPNLGAAALNRGILHCQAKRWAQARADFQRALAPESGAEPAAVHYNLAVLHLAQGDRANALASLQRALQDRPAHREALELYARLRNAP
jgi:serine/threonine protein kinase/Tfp pilus assembly protein PilF